MSTYFQFLRGSEWRKWDLHIHTPETKKHDQFEGSAPEEKWQKYIEAINNSPEEISVIGITDYFSVDNYFKFKKFISSGDITKKFDLIIPNIEIRVVPVTGSATPINLHCLFNPEIETEIETRFLAKLKFNYSGSNYSAITSELIRLGKAIPGNSTTNDHHALRAGIGQYNLSIDTLRSIFESDEKLRENTIIAVSNKSTDGVSGIRNHEDYFINNQSQLDLTRWSIYQFSDAIFSSNPNDILYFLGLGVDRKKTVLEKCGTLMPCFHGCDAHDNNKIFKPDGNRYCWIKADPTFEGLRQTLFEPEHRVKIQKDKPDYKEDKLIIDQINFISTDNKFNPHPIFLNENLNVIIGGKSSGKSILLYCIARTLVADKTFFKKEYIENKYDFQKQDNSFNFKITTKGGFSQLMYRDSSENSIIPEIKYIPQNYLVKLAEPEENKSGEALDNIIRDLIKEDSDSQKIYETFVSTLQINDRKRESIIDSYFEIKERIALLQARLKLTANRKILEENITANSFRVEELNKSTGMTDEEISLYQELQKQLNDSQLEQTRANNDYSKIKQFNTESLATITSLKNKANLLSNSLENKDFKDLFDREYSKLDTLITSINLLISFFELDNNRNFRVQSEVSDIWYNLFQVKQTIEKEIQPFVKNDEVKKQIEVIMKSINEDKLIIQSIDQLHKEINDNEKALQIEKGKLFDLYIENFNLYADVIGKLKIRTDDLEKDGLKITGLINFNFPKFRRSMHEISDGRSSSYSAFAICQDDKNHATNYELNDLINDLKLMFSAIAETETYALISRTNRKHAIKVLMTDYFFDSWEIEYKNDKVGKMSTGKASFVILMLIIGLSKSKAPILIDQPEDNLDNRSITSDLVEYLKNKKLERQIILVTHNANVVINADAENIIIANQKGQGDTDSKSKYQFDYINGSIENTFPVIPDEKDLLKSMGIREHIADIVEGGKEAFKKREEKYGFKRSN